MGDEDSQFAAHAIEAMKQRDFDSLIAAMNAKQNDNLIARSRRLDQTAAFVSTDLGRQRVEVLRAQPWYIAPIV